MKYRYEPEGVCSYLIDLELEGGLIKAVNFSGGCDGNLKAISKLIIGKRAREVAELLQGNTCGDRQTSCADQLSNALFQALNFMHY